MNTFFYFIDNEKYYYMVTTDKEPVQSGYRMLRNKNVNDRYMLNMYLLY
jgi:hypothetical protein